MPDRDPTVADLILKRLRQLIVAIAVLYVLTLGIAGGGAYYVIHQADKVQTSLCTVRQDFEHRIASTQKFLHDHPEGFAGIPAATLRKSEHDQMRTVKALSGLDC